MIRTFRDRDTRLVWERLPCKRFQAIAKVARIRLGFINDATQLLDLALPGFRLEKLKGDREGHYSIRINDQYRICFEWRGNDAHLVEIVDYH